MLEIDGNYLEGGGQIVRTALALSTLTGKPFTVKDIRKGRDKPGLKAQHLHCITALQDLCNAKVDGAFLGSNEITFVPGKIEPKTLNIDIGTAGSITLLLQAVLLPCLFHKLRLKIIGGTDVPWSMPIDYLSNVFLPHLKKYAAITLHIERRGYYPKGGGKIDIKIEPNFSFGHLEQAKVFELMQQGTLVKIEGIVHCSKLLAEREVAERMAQAAKLNLNALKAPKDIRVAYADTLSAGCGIVLWARYASSDPIQDEFNPVVLGADAIGEKQRKAEDIGKEAAAKLLDEINSGAPVDQHLADNLIPYLGIFGGSMKVSKVTNHTLTNIYAVEQFLGKCFRVENNIIKNIL